MKTKVDKSQSDIDTIMDNFDFGRAREFMVKTGWTWGMGDDAETPGEAEMRKTARKMLHLVIDEKLFYSMQGGFTAVKFPNGRLALFFGVDYIPWMWE